MGTIRKVICGQKAFSCLKKTYVSPTSMFVHHSGWVILQVLKQCSSELNWNSGLSLPLFSSMVFPKIENGTLYILFFIFLARKKFLQKNSIVSGLHKFVSTAFFGLFIYWMIHSRCVLSGLQCKSIELLLPFFRQFCKYNKHFFCNSYFFWFCWLV